MAESASNRLISADRVEGTPVYDVRGQRLGTIDRILIDKVSGKVVYADLAFGGFLGIGEHNHPLPWSILTYDTDKEGYVVNVDRERLMKAPTLERRAEIDWDDETWGRKLYDYYGVRPFWM